MTEEQKPPEKELVMPQLGAMTPVARISGPMTVSIQSQAGVKITVERGK